MAAKLPTPGERFLAGVLPANPLYRSLLGLCPTLAVTAGMKPAMTMVAATGFVLVMSNILVSLIRGLLKPHLRILVFTLTIATFVTIADRFLAAYVYEMSKALGPYVPLIIVNCLIISRAEVCASKQGVLTAISDGAGQTLGFGLALASVASVRELLGAGTWFGLDVLGPAWPAWVVMILPPGAFLTLGLLLGGVNLVVAWSAERDRRRARGAAPTTPAAAQAS